MKDQIVFCSSAKIERDLLRLHHLYEFEDAVIIPRHDCLRCSVNCPESPSYQPPTKDTPIPIRFRTLSF